MMPGSARTAVDWLTLLLRWVLGAHFIYLGLLKAVHPEQFLNLVHQYHLVANHWLLNSIAAALPWFEVFCGLLLLAGIAVRGAALVLLAMLVPFTLVVLERALGIAATQGIPFTRVKFDCGCGGGEVVIWQKMVQNSLQTILAGWLLAGRGRQLSARFSLFQKRKHEGTMQAHDQGQPPPTAVPATGP
jgi:uncharacterized membrane protein YphA (DoxX/SURF4 family)